MRTDPSSWDEMVREFARAGDLACRLLVEHVDDGAGRFRVCTQAGTTQHAAWPCPIAALAGAARDKQRKCRA